LDDESSNRNQGKQTMIKWIKNLKLMIGAATMLGVMAAAPVVHGGILWTGF
jgi:hypothetical protein